MKKTGLLPGTNVVRDGHSVQPGAVGLKNLGNTCFINSVIQCLSNSKAFSKYFTSKRLSSAAFPSGSIAEVVGRLLCDLWSGHSIEVEPKELQNSIARVRTGFGDGNQHDASEFLNFLLDVLHEDTKFNAEPPAEKMCSASAIRPQSSQIGGKRGRLGSSSASEKKLKIDQSENKIVTSSEGELAWNHYLKKNCSFIVNTFQGQLCSNVRCTSCEKMSRTYEPFLQLTLPIPERRSGTFVHSGYASGRYGRFFSVQVTVVEEDSKDCVVLQLPKTGKVKEVLSELAKRKGWRSTSQCVACIVNKHRLTKHLTLNASLKSISQTDRQNLIVYRYQELANKAEGVTIKPTDKKPCMSEVLTFRLDGSSSKTRYRLFGTPGVAFMRNLEAATPHSIREAVNKSISALYKAGSYNDYRILLGTKKHKPFLEVPEHSEKGTTLDLSKVHFTILVVWDKPVFKAKRRTMQDLPYPLADDTEDTLFADDGVQTSDDDSDEDYVPPGKKGRTSTASRSFKATVHLYDCFDFYFRSEKLGQSEAYKCSTCKKHVRAVKSLHLCRLPDVLIIHLNRFRQHARSGKKIDILIDFPLEGLRLGKWLKNETHMSRSSELELLGGKKKTSTSSQYLSSSHVYDLFAVLNHYGNLHSGHYTTFARNPYSNEWFSFNDSRVNLIYNKTRLVSKNAYILCYNRRRTKT